MARSITDEMMDLVDRLGSELDKVDPRAWSHLLVYAPKRAVGELPELHAVAHIELGDDSHDVVTLESAQAYGKKCWLAGFRHADFSDENISYLAQIRDGVAEICPDLSDGLLMNAIGGPSEVPAYVLDVVRQLARAAIAQGEKG